MCQTLFHGNKELLSAMYFGNDYHILLLYFNDILFDILVGSMKYTVSRNILSAFTLWSTWNKENTWLRLEKLYVCICLFITKSWNPFLVRRAILIESSLSNFCHIIRMSRTLTSHYYSNERWLSNRCVAIFDNSSLSFT